MILYDAYDCRINAGEMLSEETYENENPGADKNPTTDLSGEPVSRVVSVHPHVAAQKEQCETYEEKHCRLQRRALWVQIALCIFTALAFGAAAWYASIARNTLTEIRAQTSAVKESADAARSAADTAANTLTEIKRGGVDTHELAVAAQMQATNSAEQAGELKTLSDATARAADTSARQLITSQRPRIAVQIVPASGVFFDANGANMKFRLTLVNTGHSTATHVWIDPILIHLRPDVNVAHEQQRVCTEGRARAMDMGDALFVGEQTAQEWGLNIDYEQIRKGVIPNMLSMDLAGCITYVFPFDNSVHQTGFLYDVHRIDPAHPGAAFAVFTNKGDVPIENMGMYRINFEAGNFAN